MKSTLFHSGRVLVCSGLGDVSVELIARRQKSKVRVNYLFLFSHARAGRSDQLVTFSLNLSLNHPVSLRMALVNQTLSNRKNDCCICTSYVAIYLEV